MAATFSSDVLQSSDAYLYVEDPAKLTAQGNGMLALTVLFLITTWITTILRLYVRHYIIKAIGADDLLAIAALVCVTGSAIPVLIFTHSILSSNIQLAAGETPNSGHLILVLMSSLYSATMVVFKFALGMFFVRLFKSRRAYLITIWISMVVPSILGVMNIIWTGLYPCDIGRIFFIGIPSCQGVNLNNAWEIIAMVWSAMTALTDLSFGILSILAMRNLQMPFRDKMVAALLCAMGSIGSLASFVKLGILIAPSASGVSLLGLAILGCQWSIIEPGIGLTATNLATLRPLMKKDDDNDSRDSEPAEQAYRDNSQNQESLMLQWSSKIIDVKYAV